MLLFSWPTLDGSWPRSAKNRPSSSKRASRDQAKISQMNSPSFQALDANRAVAKKALLPKQRQISMQSEKSTETSPLVISAKRSHLQRL
jgi:hypothetical protein